MNRLAIALTIFLLHGVVTAQDQKTSRPKFLTAEGFLSNADLVQNEKQKFVKELDPANRFSLDQHQRLWSNNIILKLPVSNSLSQPRTERIGDDAELKIDAFGLSTTGLIHRKHPTLAVELMKKVNREVVGKPIEYDELFDLVRVLKTQVDQAWARSHDKDNQSLTIRATLTSHRSRINSKYERWFLVEVFHTKNSEYDQFVNDFMENQQPKRIPFEVVASEQLRLDSQFFIAPHPKVLESLHIEKNQTRKKNRAEPSVTVHDDKLTLVERERVHDFELIDKTKRKTHQIEGCYWRSVDDRRAQRALEEARGLFSERVPLGASLTFEELHLRMGSVASVLQRSFQSID